MSNVSDDLSEAASGGVEAVDVGDAGLEGVPLQRVRSRVVVSKVPPVKHAVDPHEIYDAEDMLETYFNEVMNDFYSCYSPQTNIAQLQNWNNNNTVGLQHLLLL